MYFARRRYIYMYFATKTVRFTMDYCFGQYTMFLVLTVHPSDNHKSLSWFQCTQARRVALSLYSIGSYDLLDTGGRKDCT